MYKKLLSFVITLLVVFTNILPAQAAVKFSYRSTSNTQAYYAAGLRDMVRIDGGSTMPSLVAGPSGTFGGTMLQTSAAVTNIEWPCHDNGPIGAAGFTVLIRTVPNFTGTLSSARGGLFTIGNTRSQRAYWGGISIYIDSTSKVRLGSGSRSNGGNYFNAAQFNYAITFTQNVPIDIWVTWDGTTTAGAAKLYTADNGNTPTLRATLTAGAANTELWNRAAMASISNSNVADFVNTFLGDLNEMVIWDEVIDPTSFGARTDFIPVPADNYSGYTYTSLAASEVKTGTAYGPGPGTLTGTYTGSDRWTDPGVANVRSGTAYKADSTSNNRTGTMAVPAASNVLVGVAVDATTGTYVGVTAGEVKTGTSFGVGLTGTYDGSDRWTCPLAGQLSNGVQLKCNSTSLNLTGTLDSVTNVLSSQTMTGSSTSGVLVAQ